MILSSPTIKVSVIGFFENLRYGVSAFDLVAISNGINDNIAVHSHDTPFFHTNVLPLWVTVEALDRAFNSVNRISRFSLSFAVPFT